VHTLFDSAICEARWNTPSSSSPRVTSLCDLDHILRIRIRVTLDLVKNRVIAGLMVIAMLGGSGTVTFASLTSGPAMMQHPTAAHQHSQHACCPAARPLTHPVLFLESSEPVTPCSEHPCCAKRRPQGPASLPAVNEGKSPELDIVKVEPPSMLTSTPQADSRIVSESFSPPYSARSSVLRI